MCSTDYTPESSVFTFSSLELLSREEAPVDAVTVGMAHRSNLNTSTLSVSSTTHTFTFADAGVPDFVGQRRVGCSRVSVTSSAPLEPFTYESTVWIKATARVKIHNFNQHSWRSDHRSLGTEVKQYRCAAVGTRSNWRTIRRSSADSRSVGLPTKTIEWVYKSWIFKPAYTVLVSKGLLNSVC